MDWRKFGSAAAAMLTIAGVYFGFLSVSDKVPREFWRLIAVCSFVALLASIRWAAGARRWRLRVVRDMAVSVRVFKRFEFNDTDIGGTLSVRNDGARAMRVTRIDLGIVNPSLNANGQGGCGAPPIECDLELQPRESATLLVGIPTPANWRGLSDELHVNFIGWAGTRWGQENRVGLPYPEPIQQGTTIMPHKVLP